VSPASAAAVSRRDSPVEKPWQAEIIAVYGLQECKTDSISNLFFEGETEW
jgi:hypothetical protein